MSSGTITTSNFFNAWASHGMNLGTLNYQILATEAWGGGSGTSDVTVNSGGSTTPPTTQPTTPPTTTPPTGNGCHATYSVANSWAGGFQANVTVANSGSSPINGWTVDLDLPNGQSISSLWNGVNSGTSGAVTVRNASYNGTIAPGGSTSFGYTGTGDGSLIPGIGCANS